MKMVGLFLCGFLSQSFLYTADRDDKNHQAVATAVHAPHVQQLLPAMQL